MNKNNINMDGFEKIHLSSKAHNKIFKYRHRSIFKKFVYWYNFNTGTFSAEEYASFLVKVINILLIPFYVFVAGVPQTIKEIKELLWQKKHRTYIRHESYIAVDKMKKLIKGDE